MEDKKNIKEGNELFLSSHLMMILTYTIFSVILIGETFVMNWEKWAVVLIVAGVVTAWYIHFSRIGNSILRLWICSLLMMVTFFFYGTHPTSTYDLAVVICIVMFLYTMTGIHSLITLCQVTYYITLAYEIINLVQSGEVFDSLLISRTFLHVAVVTMTGWIARTIIDKWNEVLDQSKEELKYMQEASSRLSDFIANVSHEIRTPINAILGMCGMSLSDEKDEGKRANITAIEDAGKRIGEQISDILDYSEIDRSNLTNNYENYMLSSVFNDIVNELKPYFKPDIELIINVDASIPSVMNSDVGKLKKILKHLISNGLKYTNEGGVYVHVSRVKHDYGINLCIEVRDTGIGMSPEQLERIYEDFYKADSGRTRTTGGLGLGMIIVQGFVRSLGGFMTVESELGNGTVVRVSIPNTVVDESECMSVKDRESISLGAYLHFDKYANPSVREYYDSMVKNIVTGLKVSMHRVDNTASLRALTDNKKLTHLFAGPEEYESAADFMEELAKEIIVTVIANPDQLKVPVGSRVRIMPKPFYCFPVVSVLNSTHDSDDHPEGSGMLVFPDVRALVVDDEPMNLIVTTEMLKRYGMVVTTCESGQEAISLCHENDYDVILMDHMMPVMDGVETMKRIRADQAAGRTVVPIVAFTANAVSSAKEMFRREGFDGFIGKPVDRVELERVLRKLLPNACVISKEANAAYPVTKEKNEEEKQDTLLGRLSRLGIDTSQGIRYCNGDDKFYETLVIQYSKESHSKKKIMSDSLENGNMKDYSVQVHSIKSTSKMIGALELSERAKLLEEAAKREDIDFVRSNHDAMLSEYERVLHAIDPDGETNEDAVGAKAEDDDILEFIPDTDGPEGGKG